MIDLRNLRGEIPSLNGLRALSILLVLCSHFITTIFPGGLGVNIFFVISGFLITHLIIVEARDAGTLGFRNFYIRRFLRLYPVILFYVAVVLAVNAMTRRSWPVNIDEPLSVLFFFTNYQYASMLTSGGGVHDLPFKTLWSLAVEEHFYLFFPACALLCMRRPRVLAPFLGLMILAPLLLRIFANAYLRMPAEDLEWKIYAESHFRMDSLAIGALLAFLLHRPFAALNPLALQWGLWLGLGLILFTLIYRGQDFRNTLRYTLQNIGVFIVLLSIVTGHSPKWVVRLLNWSILVWIGRLSYSLYVWHTYVAYLLEDTPMGIWKSPVMFVLSFAVASVSYYGLELKVVALRRRFGSRVKF